MRVSKTYIGAALIAVGGITGFLDYTGLGNLILASGYGTVFVGLAHKIERGLEALAEKETK